MVDADNLSTPSNPIPKSFSERLALAEQYITDLQLTKATPSVDDLRYLFLELALPRYVLEGLLQTRKLFWLLERAGINTGSQKNIVKPRLPNPDKTITPIQGKVTLDNHEGRNDKYTSAMQKAQAYVQTRGLRSNKPTSEDLITLYETFGLPTQILADLLGCSGATVRNWLHLAGVGIRTAADQKHLSTMMNHQFFKQWSPQMAWVLGLLYTDGHLSNETVTFSSTDHELLVKVRALVAPQLPINVYQNTSDQKKYIGQLSFRHPELVADIIALGMQERKSLTMKFPDIPAQMMRHFIRGCWDGDGGFSLSTGKLSGHYTCGSLEFITRMRDELFKAGINRKILRYKSPDRHDMELAHGSGPYPLTVYMRRDSKAYDLRLGSDEQLVAISRFLYKQVPNSIYLSRKRDLLRNYILKLPSST